MNPVVERMCSYESLKDGSLTLLDIAIMNEALEVRSENRERLMDAYRRESGG